MNSTEPVGLTGWAKARQFISTHRTLIAIILLTLIAIILLVGPMRNPRNPDKWVWNIYVSLGINLLCCVLLAFGWRDLGKSQFSRTIRWFLIPLQLPMSIVVAMFASTIMGLVFYFTGGIFILLIVPVAVIYFLYRLILYRLIDR